MLDKMRKFSPLDEQPAVVFFYILHFVWCNVLLSSLWCDAFRLSDETAAKHQVVIHCLILSEKCCMRMGGNLSCCVVISHIYSHCPFVMYLQPVNNHLKFGRHFVGHCMCIIMTSPPCKPVGLLWVLSLNLLSIVYRGFFPRLWSWLPTSNFSQT